MSDNVTLHNGHCSYHGPADEAPVWANRSAGDGFSSSAQKKKAGAHTAHVGTTGKKQVLKTCADAPGLVRTHDQPMVEGAPSQVGKSLPKVSDAPAPLTSFEDTTHAWEEGYRAGREAMRARPPIEADGYNIEEMLANLGAHPEWPAMRKAGDVKLYFLNEGDAHKIRFAALEGLA